MDGCIAALKAKCEAMSDDGVFLERMTLLEEAYGLFRYETQALRYAKAFCHVLEHLTIVIHPEDRLIGRVKEVVLNEADSLAYNEKAEANNFQAINLFSFEALEQTPMADPKYRYAPEWFHSWGHNQPDFDKLLAVGFTGLKTEILGGLAEENTEEEHQFLSCALLAVEGILNYIKRAIAVAETVAFQSDGKQVLANLQALLEGPPQTFGQAVQMVWLVNFITHTVCGARDYALGRMDKYLVPFYNRDLKSGICTAESAALYIDDFIIKTNEIIGRGWEAYNAKRILCVNSIQYVMLSGMDKDGCDVTNPVSWMLLEGVNRLRLKQPTLNIRWHDGIDRDFWDRACEISAMGFGNPAFFNDQVVLPALGSCGIAKEDAVDYGYYGCNNSILSGKEDELRESWHNVPLYLELALNQGCRFGQGQVIGADTAPIAQMETLDALLDALYTQMCFGVEKAARRIERGDAKWNEMKPFSVESILMTHCIQRKSTFNQKGSTYRHMTNHFVGIANVANSLYNIQQWVYVEKRFALTQLVDILKANWQGYETLREEALYKMDKYGNDLDHVDQLAVDVANLFIKAVKRYSPLKNGRVLYPSIYSLWHQRALGLEVGATADGRWQGAELSEMQSPTFGTDKDGPTGVMNSIAKLPLDQTPTGGVNFKFQPSLFANNPALLGNLLTGYFQKGGMHAQINVIDNAMLEDAKLHPENYANLLVRVVGYSAYFVTLSPEQQDEIIRRTALA